MKKEDMIVQKLEELKAVTDRKDCNRYRVQPVSIAHRPFDRR